MKIYKQKIDVFMRKNYFSNYDMVVLKGGDHDVRHKLEGFDK